MSNLQTFEDYLIEQDLVEFFLLSTKIIVETAEELLSSVDFTVEESDVVKECNLYLRAVTNDFTSISCFSDTAVSLKYHVVTRKINRVFTNRVKSKEKNESPLLANFSNFSMN